MSCTSRTHHTTIHRYANNIGTADECVACSVNAYQGLAGRSSCESCALGQFQPLIGQSACLETPPPTPVPTQPPTYDGSLRLDVSLKLNATADLNRNSSRCVCFSKCNMSGAQQFPCIRLVSSFTPVHLTCFLVLCGW